MALSRDILDRNLAALRTRQPDVADAIAESAFPNNIAPATGRDGTPTLRVAGQAHGGWLGGSSMPRVSAEELFSNIDARTGSVTLPAMLTGMECVVVAGRLSPRSAVFVVDHASALSAVCQIRDLTELLQNGRLVLILADDMAARMEEFFRRHPGYCAPEHLFRVPQLSAGEQASLTRIIEDATVRAVRVQQALIEAQSRRWQAESSTGPTVRKAAILSADDSAANASRARSLESAFRERAVETLTCFPQSPDTCHFAHRLHMAASFKPDIILHLPAIASHERSRIPREIPVISWCPPSAALPTFQEAHRRDLVIVENMSERDRAEAAGWPQRQIVLWEPAAPMATAAIQESALASTTLAVLMDLPDDRPGVVGVSLPSQISLWQAAQHEVLRRADRYEPDQASQILDAAQKASGTRLTDSALLRQFEHCILTRIAPAVISRSLGTALVRHGLKPHFWGTGWPSLGRGQDLRRGPIPSETEVLAQIFGQSQHVIFPLLSHQTIQWALQALALGRFVSMRGQSCELESEYPGLAELSPLIGWYQSSSKLIDLVRRSQSESAMANARKAGSLVRRNHTYAVRLQSLLSGLNEFHASACTRVTP